MSKPHAEVPPGSDSVRSQAGAVRVAPGWSDTQVKASARYVRFQQSSVEVARLLAELGGTASLRAGTVVLSKPQADAVYANLGHAKGTAHGSTLAVTVASGNTARMTSGEPSGPHLEGSGAVRIASRAEFEPRALGASLEVTPKMLADNAIEMKIEVKVSAFEGFLEYGGRDITVANTNGVKTVVSMPNGFYQPVFSTATVRTEVRAPSGSVVVVMVDEEAETEGREMSSEVTLRDKPSVRETWILFIHVEAASVEK